jgi:hypothetical protein
VTFSTQGASRDQIRGAPAGRRRLLFSGVQEDIIRAFARWFNAQGAGGQGVIMQVKGVDSTQANGGLSLRFWFPSSLGTQGLAVCRLIAQGMDVYGAASDAAADTAKLWLKTNVFDPYSTATTSTALGYVQWRPSMPECAEFTTSIPTAASDSGTFDGSVVYLSLTKPTISTKSATGDGQATLTWTELSHFTTITYTAKCVAATSSPACGDADVGVPGTGTVSGGTVSGTVTGLTPGSSFYCFAKAVDADGQLACSDPALVAVPLSKVTSGLVLDLDASVATGTSWPDSSGNNLGATLTSASMTSNNFGGIVQCNEIGPNWVSGQYSSLLDISGVHSFELWFKPTGSYPAWKGIFTISKMQGLWINPGATLIRWQRKKTDGSYITVDYTFGTMPMQKNKWYHIVVTASLSLGTTTHRIYVDGSLQTTATCAACTFAPHVSPEVYRVCSGVSGDGSVNYGTFDVGVARMYNRPLTSAEVRQNFRASLDRFSDVVLSSTSLTSPAGDIASWQNIGKNVDMPSTAAGSKDGTATLPQYKPTGTYVSLNGGATASGANGNYLDLGASLKHNLPTNNGMTVFSYVRFTSIDEYWPRIFEFATGVGANSIMAGLNLRTGQLAAHLGVSSGSQFTSNSGVVVPLNTWTTVVARIQQTGTNVWQWALWIDGTKYLGSATSLTFPSLTSTKNYIGKGSYIGTAANDEFMQMDVREFRVLLSPQPDNSIAEITGYMTSLYV